MRVHLLHTVGVAILRVEAFHHVRTDAGQRMVLDHRRAGLQHGHAIPAARIAKIEHRHDAVRDPIGCQREQQRDDHRDQASQAEVLEDEQQADADADTHPRTARERERERDDERRHDERRPDSVAHAKDDARGRNADHQHQGAGVRHVMAHRPTRPQAQAVEVEHAVLDDSVRGGQCANRDDHLEYRSGAGAARHVVYHWDDQKEIQLPAVDEALDWIDRERRRNQRDRGVGEQRPEEARCGGTCFVAHQRRHPGEQQQDQE